MAKMFGEGARLTSKLSQGSVARKRTRERHPGVQRCDASKPARQAEAVQQDDSLGGCVQQLEALAVRWRAVQGSDRAGEGDQTTNSSSCRDISSDSFSTNLGDVSSNVCGSDIISSSSGDVAGTGDTPSSNSSSSSRDVAATGDTDSSSSSGDVAATGDTDSSSSSGDVAATGDTDSSSSSSSGDVAATGDTDSSSSSGGDVAATGDSDSSSSSGDVAATGDIDSNCSSSNCASYSDKSFVSISWKEAAHCTSLLSSHGIRAAAMSHLKQHVKAGGDHWVLVQCGNWEEHPLGWQGPAVAVLQLWDVGGHHFDYSLWVVNPLGVVTGDKYYSLTGKSWGEHCHHRNNGAGGGYCSTVINVSEL